MSERLSNLGYGALKKETTIGTPVIPNVFFPLYKDTLNLDMKLDEDNPIMGVRSNPYNMFPGMRTFEGILTVMGEPNTAEYWFDMLLAAGNITGGGDPYTHPFTEGLSNSYTIDLLRGQVVHRYFGVMADEITPSFNKDKMELEVGVSALGAFMVGQIATVSTTTITLDTTYQANPNLGLVPTDVVRIMKADGSTTLDTTVSSVNADGITVVLGASAAAYSAGDFIFLRPQTPSYTILTPFLWAKTQFQFATTAATAQGQASSAQTNLEEGSKWKLTHGFENKGGSPRSGNFNPASLPRTQTMADLSIKKFFDNPDDLNRFLRTTGYACVIRHFSGGTNNHELRITLNNIFQKTSKRPLESGKIIYNEIDYTAAYNTSDGQLMDVKVINALAT